MVKATTLLHACFRRKRPQPACDALSPSSASDRPLSLLDLTLLGIGGTLGSGLFLLTGHAARSISGPAVTISFLIAGVACLFSALSYAEMSSRNPNSGGAYAFAYASLGELCAFLVGMCLTLEYGVSAAAIARSCASYLGDLVPLPAWTVGRDSFLCALGAALVAAVSALLSLGMKQAKWVINAATVVYAGVVVVIVAVGWQKIDKDNWSPFAPFGVNGVIAGASAVFFAYIGFDEVASVAEEAQDAPRTVPLAILLSLGVVSLMYVLASLTLTGLSKYDMIDAAAPFSAALRGVGLTAVSKLVGVGTMLGMMNTTLVSMAAQPRVFMSMGRDGLLPRALGRSTRVTTLGCGAVVSVLALVVPTQSLADVVSGGTLLAFLATNVGLLLTRARLHTGARRAVAWVYMFVGASVVAGVMHRIGGEDPVWSWIGLAGVMVVGFVLIREEFEGGVGVEGEGPTFLCPAVPLVPLGGAFTTTFLVVQLGGKALMALIGWLVMAVAGYVSYGMRNALVGREYTRLGAAPASPTGSYNSFDELAVEAKSVGSETEEEEREM